MTLFEEHYFSVCLNARLRAKDTGRSGCKRMKDCDFMSR